MAQNSDDALLIPEFYNSASASPTDDDALLVSLVNETELVRPFENDTSSAVHTNSTPTDDRSSSAAERSSFECRCRWCRDHEGAERPHHHHDDHHHDHHHHEHRRRSHRPRWRVHHSHCQTKCKQANLPAAFCSAMAVILFCTAMAEPRWFNFHGGGCEMHDTHEPVTSFGLTKFVHTGHFLSVAGSSFHSLYSYSSGISEVLVDCVTPEIVEYLRMVIALCFIGLATAMTQFLLDMATPTNKYFRLLHRNSVFSIITVLICVAIHGLCYWITELIKIFENTTRTHKGSRVQVSFGIGFYLIAGTGVVSIAAIASTLLRCRGDSRRHQERLFGTYEGIDFGPEFGPHVSETCASAAPPAYTP